MVLVDAAIAWRDKKFTERVRKAADRARAGSATDDPVTKAMAEALAEARAETGQAWSAWHERCEDARARGVPFNEPAPDENPPGVFTERVRKAADRARAGSVTDPVAKAVAEALAQERAETNQAWRAWHERREDARARGVPFDEAPPAP